MKEETLNRVTSAKSYLKEMGIFFRELNNGQLQVDGINFWATTEKWYDPKDNEKGIGMNSFLNYLKDKKIV